MHTHEHNQESALPVKKRSFRRLSFFKQNNSSKPVINTHILNKEYDVETGNKIINNYMIIREIGRGVHGKVKLAEDLETGELVAIKIVDKQSRKRQLGYSLLTKNNSDLVESELKIRREIAILKKCLHPNVVKLKEVIDDPTSKKIYLALEYMEGGEILWRDEKRDLPILSMEESRHIFRDVVCGLDYLHYQGIIHRDIKPANLLLSTTENIVKISDFGVSYYNENGNERELLETAGTPAFFAPELCSSIENQQQLYTITKSIDIWALGVTLYCFIYGQCPFTASTEFELFDIIPTQPLHIPTKDEIGFDTPNALIDLFTKLLEKDPMKRITLEQVKHHPWVIEDLNNPSLWYKQSDPTQYKAVPSIIEYQHTTSFMDKLRKSINRILSSFTFNHISTEDHSCTPNTPSHTSMTTHTNTTISPLSSHIYQEQQEQEEDYRQDKGWIPTSFTKMTLSTSSSEESITPPPVKKNTLPFAVDRNSSSSSSMSGLVVSFSRRPSEHHNN